jgi:hypothetical protein
VTADLTVIPKQDYQRCFQEWQDYGNKCVYAEGRYVDD